MNKMIQSQPGEAFAPDTVFFESQQPGAPAIVGHYCHCTITCSGFIQLSGQKAWDPATGVLIDGGIEEQTELVLENILAVLASLDLDFSALSRLVCHLHSVDHYEPFNRVYSSVLGSAKPARSVMAGAELRGGALIEIVADAFSSRYIS